MAESLLDQRVAVVTGAGQGIGLEIARSLTGHGARVVLADIDAELVDKAAADIGGIGVACDVTSEEQVGNLVAEALRNFGRLDVFVNNAGVSPIVPLLEMDQATWEETQRVNEWALFHCGQPAARQMVAQGGGSIVVIGSPAAEDAYDAQTAYCASKAGVHMLAMGMAWEWGPLGVRTNVVQPGWIETSMNRRYLREADVRERVTKQVPLRRLGAPDEVAPAVLWLCSEGAGYVNGATIQVDGGQLAGRPTVVSKRLEWART